MGNNMYIRVSGTCNGKEVDQEFRAGDGAIIFAASSVEPAEAGGRREGSVSMLIAGDFYDGSFITLFRQLRRSIGRLNALKDMFAAMFDD